MKKTINFLALGLFSFGLSYLGNLFAVASEKSVSDNAVGEFITPQDKIESKDYHGEDLNIYHVDEAMRARRARQERERREAEEAKRSRKREQEGQINRRYRGRGYKDLDKLSPTRLLIKESVYFNQKGNAIIDAKSFKGICKQEQVVACTVCRKKISLKNICSHYKDTKHRFFTKTKFAKHKKH